MVAHDHYPRIMVLRKLRDKVQYHSTVLCLKNIKPSHTRKTQNKAFSSQHSEGRGRWISVS